MSLSTVSVKIAALRLVSESTSLNNSFSILISVPTTVVETEFMGSGEVEMAEVAVQAGSSETIDVSVLENGIPSHKKSITMENIATQSDWSIVQTETFEVRIQFLIATPIPKDVFENTLEIIGGPKAWYFRAEDLYSLLKVTAHSLRLPSGQVVDGLVRLVDLATETIVKRLSPLTSKDISDVIVKVDEILTSQAVALDSVVDASRLKLVESLRNLRESLESNLKIQRERIVASAISTKELASNVAERVSSSVDTAAVETAKSVTIVRTRVTQLSEESRSWATAFLQARVQQGKDALSKAQPYVVSAVETSQPYVAKVASAAEPLVSLAKPYVTPVLSEAMRLAEENKYVGPYVEQCIGQATHVIEEAKAYCGVKDDYFTSTTVATH